MLINNEVVFTFKDRVTGPLYGKAYVFSQYGLPTSIGNVEVITCHAHVKKSGNFKPEVRAISLLRQVPLFPVPE